jgi:hypothetical protein
MPVSDIFNNAIRIGKLPGRNTLLGLKLNEPQPINLNPWTFPGRDASPVFLRNDPNVVPVAQRTPLDQTPTPPVKPADLGGYNVDETFNNLPADIFNQTPTRSSSPDASPVATALSSLTSTLPPGMLQWTAGGVRGQRPNTAPIYTAAQIPKLFG